ncbi:hypothetical protein [Nonomuraea cavernae]|uniref:Uncharacterized protein n=1 Tax=Nonomuraea cavernae TaxID=2045107 RepID=A0A917Z5R4_9ACTN|nr:hypothetical protein [Nonomuraea cavernae]MCA2186964.1 hypothetical protein [Nonomuraea cavernae]GGO75164.1 hypothetical protein GCM10012289_49560 [Nonomuraea cavernae]
MANSTTPAPAPANGESDLARLVEDHRKLSADLDALQSSRDALVAMRDALGVDQITGLDLADAVKCGIVLGQLLASDADGRIHTADLTDHEHDALRLAVQDILDRRRGVDPDEDRLITVFRVGSLSAWSIAAELGMDARDIARTANSDDVTNVFTDDERARLLDVIVAILDERDGVRVAGFEPVALPYDAEGRCADPECISCYPVVDQLGGAA